MRKQITVDVTKMSKTGTNFNNNIKYFDWLTEITGTIREGCDLTDGHP